VSSSATRATTKGHNAHQSRYGSERARIALWKVPVATKSGRLRFPVTRSTSVNLHMAIAELSVHKCIPQRSSWRVTNTLVVRWVDHLGRNYPDVTDTIRHFMRQGVTIRAVINSMTFDGATTDPTQQAVRDALIDFMAATAQAQAEATKEAQKAVIEHAKTEKPEAYRGRKPSYNRDQLNLVRDMTGTGAGTSEVARATGLSRQTVLRIRGDMAEAEAALARWGI